MPILNVKVAAARSDKLSNEIASTLVELTRRVLGKTGVEVTILNGGTARAPGRRAIGCG